MKSEQIAVLVLIKQQIQDAYQTTLLVEDLLQEDIILADTRDGQPLSIDHGAPLRPDASEHYAYKNQLASEQLVL